MSDQQRRVTGVIGAIMVVAGTIMVTLTGGDVQTFVGLGSTGVGLVTGLLAAFSARK